MVKKVTYQQDAMTACLEKFAAYAAPRHITLITDTYGFYEVRRSNTKKVLGAVRATKEDGTTGWVINWANKQRKFISDDDKSVVVGRKVSSEECLKAHKPHKPAPVVTDEEED